jgi:hypothetical protein
MIVLIASRYKMPDDCTRTVFTTNNDILAIIGFGMSWVMGSDIEDEC